MTQTLATPLRHACRAGFTLIEMSIVLAIIGFIVGGVLLGRELVSMVEIRAQVSQIEEMRTAVATFQLKYDCLPGDCANATAHFPAATQPEKVSNGNGSGIIGATNTDGGCSAELCPASENTSWVINDYNCGVHTGGPHDVDVRAEYICVFDHLAAAGVVDMAQYDETDRIARNTVGVGFPNLKITSSGSGPTWETWGVYSTGGLLIGSEPESTYIPRGNKIRLGAANGSMGTFTSGLNPWEARQVDEKIDDGKPFSGTAVITERLYIYREVYNYCASGDWANPQITVNRYRNENELETYDGKPVYRYCSMSILAGF